MTERQNKKRRSSGNETIVYLREKNESEKEPRQKEIEVKQKELNLTRETQEAFQRQQGEMMKTFQQMAQQQQQQQNAALLSILESLLASETEKKL